MDEWQARQWMSRRYRGFPIFVSKRDSGVLTLTVFRDNVMEKIVLRRYCGSVRKWIARLAKREWENRNIHTWSARMLEKWLDEE